MGGRLLLIASGVVLAVVGVRILWPIPEAGRFRDFISQERLLESGGVVMQNAQADDSSPSAGLMVPATVRNP